MQHTLRRLAEGALLVSVCVALGCGGGSGSWGFQAEEGDWLVDMTIQTSGCAPTIMRQFHADVVALNSSRSALVIYLRTFYDCPIGEWNLPGTWTSSTYLDMDNHEDTFVCQFADRWGIGRFTVRSFSLDFPGGGGAFSGSGSFSGSIDGAMCDGTIAFVGVQP